MSEFECPVVRIERVEPHPGADRLDLVYFRDFAVISQRGLRKVGDLVVYVPQDSIVPEYLLKQGFYKYDVEVVGPALPEVSFTENPVTNTVPVSVLRAPGSIYVEGGLQYRVLDTGKGMLAGGDGNRVKPLKLRGILSEGIMFPVDNNGPDGGPDKGLIWNPYHVSDDGTEGLIVTVGDNAAEYLNITKYEPVLPPSMSGDCVYIGTNIIPHFDIENIKKYPDIIDPEWEVNVTEKLHGTFFGIGYIPGLNHPDLWHSDFFCYSKGMGNRGLVFKNTENNKNNLYVKQFEKVLENFMAFVDVNNYEPEQAGKVFLMGEIFGKGVQDLDYGSKEASFRAFEGYIKDGWLNWDNFNLMTNFLKVDTVPVLFKGKFKDYNKELKNGNSTLAKHVREGVVIKPTSTKKHRVLGRIILKDINEKYLTRKGGTEYN